MKALSLSQDIVGQAAGIDQTSRRPHAVECSDELNRLLSAAIVNRNFCRKLLTSPLAAISEGYCGYQFQLPEREARIVATIRSLSLDDFARQLIAKLAQSQTSEPATPSKQRVRVRVGVAVPLHVDAAARH